MPDTDAQIDLPAYLARIGYTGPLTPSLATLQAIQALHPAAIPFESLDSFLGRPVSLDLPSIQQKLVHSRRGGYCYEHNTLLRAALDAIGFATTGLAGRVLWMAPPDRPTPPRTHMLLKVDLPEGPYLADVGFGGHLSSTAIPLIPDILNSTPTDTVRLAETGGTLTLQTNLSTSPTARVWHNIYSFTLEPHLPADYAMANWFTSTHPSSILRLNLMAERLTSIHRISLLNTAFTRRTSDGRTEKSQITSAENLAKVLDEKFGIEIPVGAEELFERIKK